MAYEVQKAHWHQLFGYNSPHLPLGTNPADEEAAIEESPIGDAHEFSETLEPAHSPKSKKRPRRSTATHSHEATEEELRDISAPTSVVTPDPLMEQIETSQNEYKEDLVDPEQMESVETSQNEYRGDKPEDYVEAHNSENTSQESENS